MSALQHITEKEFFDTQGASEKGHNPAETHPTSQRFEPYYDHESCLPISEHWPEQLSGFANETARTFTVERATSYVVRCLATLVPSFLATHTKTHTPRILKSTAWLDGLRGVAALLVVIHHHSGLWYLPLWRLSPTTASGPWEIFFQQPYIKLFYFAGSFYVAIFFVISGYSLSYRPLTLLRSNQAAKFLDALSSSAFRRAFRLFIPPSVVTFVIMLTVQLGWRTPEDPAFTASTFLQNIGMWLYDTAAHFDVLRAIPTSLEDSARYHSAYNIHLWTIAIEYQGSMAVFLVLLAICKLTTTTRMAVVSAVIAYGFYFNYLYHVTFIAGILLAEANMIYADSSKTIMSLSPRTSTILRESCSIGLFISSLALALSSPRLERFSAILVVFAINYSDLLQLLFTTSFAQYLGRISFSLYMVHGTIMISFCFWLMPWIGSFIRHTDAIDLDFVVTTILTSFISFPLTFCVADWFTRFVDEKAVHLAAVIWKKVAVIDN